MGPESPVTSYWWVRFEGVSCRYDWADRSETRTYACKDGVVTWEEEIAGQYDSPTRILTWFGKQYRQVE